METTGKKHTKSLDTLIPDINKLLVNLTYKKKVNVREEQLSKFLINKGQTTVKININENDKSLIFELKNKRNLDRKTLNLIRNREISTLIS